MASAAGQGTHAPCHSDGDRTTPHADHGHDCCAWVAPSSASGKFFTQKNDAPVDELATAYVATPVFVGWSPPLLIRPPPPLRTSRYLPAAAGGDTFLRTGRLRL